MLTELAQTCRAIIDTYLSDDTLMHQLAGLYLLKLDSYCKEDISLLWPHSSGPLPDEPPSHFYPAKPPACQTKENEKKRKNAASTRYHAHVSQIVNELPSKLLTNEARPKEKKHVRNYHILANLYLSRNPEYLPDIERISSELLLKASKHISKQKKKKSKTSGKRTKTDEGSSNDNEESTDEESSSSSSSDGNDYKGNSDNSDADNNEGDSNNNNNDSMEISGDSHKSYNYPRLLSFSSNSADTHIV